jgi:transposase
MDKHSVVYVGVDAAKAKHAVALAERGRNGEVRYLGEIDTSPAAIERLVRKLERKYAQVHVCYEAGPTGYGLYRQIRALGHACDVIAPSLVPTRPGDRVKTNRRDAVTLARLLRAGELTAIWVPDAIHEAVRDLVRAREVAADDLRRKRQQLLLFLLRHGRSFTGRRHWSQAHARWLAGQAFHHPAQQIVFQDQVDAMADARARLDRLDRQLAELVPSWSMAPLVAAYQAMRGVSFLVAVIFAAEMGDVRRFENPRQLMAFLGLVPSERSTGETAARSARRVDPDGQSSRSAGSGGGRLELSTSSAGQRDDPVSPGRSAQGSSRDCLDGSGPAMRTLQAASGCRQGGTRCGRGDCPRDGGLFVGDRPARAAVLRRFETARDRDGAAVGNSRGPLRGRALPPARN